MTGQARHSGQGNTRGEVQEALLGLDLRQGWYYRPSPLLGVMQLSDRLSQGLRLKTPKCPPLLYQMIPGGDRPDNNCNEKGMKPPPLLGQNPFTFGTHTPALQDQKETAKAMELQLHSLLFRKGSAEFLRVSCMGQQSRYSHVMKDSQETWQGGENT